MKTLIRSLQEDAYATAWMEDNGWDEVMERFCQHYNQDRILDQLEVARDKSFVVYGVRFQNGKPLYKEGSVDEKTFDYENHPFWVLTFKPSGEITLEATVAGDRVFKKYWDADRYDTNRDLYAALLADSRELLHKKDLTTL